MRKSSPNPSSRFSSSVLIAYLMPAVMMFIPLYQVFTALHLTNSLVGLMLVYPSFGLPFATWLMMGYYASIPKEMEEAALPAFKKGVGMRDPDFAMFAQACGGRCIAARGTDADWIDHCSLGMAHCRSLRGGQWMTARGMQPSATPITGPS